MFTVKRQIWRRGVYSRLNVTLLSTVHISMIIILHWRIFARKCTFLISGISLTVLTMYFPHNSHLNHHVHPSHPACQSLDPAPLETPSSLSPFLPQSPFAPSHGPLDPPCVHCYTPLAILFSKKKLALHPGSLPCPCNLSCSW